MDEVKDSGPIIQIIKGVLATFIIALIGILIFAFIVKFAVLNSGVVKAVNQFIKVLSIFLGCTICVRKNLGLIKGALIGLLFTAVIYLTFALIGSNVSFGITFLIEIIFTSIIGAISGVIAVNMKK